MVVPGSWGTVFTCLLSTTKIEAEFHFSDSLGEKKKKKDVRFNQRILELGHHKPFSIILSDISMM